MNLWSRLEGQLRQFLNDAWQFPWKTTALTLRERFREDRLGVTASSLTFTTIISLVPLFTVGLAVFSAFPMFGRMQAGLQKWLVESLIPDAIARQVLMYLNQFAAKAGQLSLIGGLAFFATAFSALLTINRTLNRIWRVRRPRSLAHRLTLYWVFLTLGPLVFAISIAVNAQVAAELFAQTGQRGVQLLLQQAQPVHMLAQAPPGLGGHTGLAAHHQCTAHALFEQTNALRHGRRCDVQGARGALKTAFAHHRVQGKQRGVVEH